MVLRTSQSCSRCKERPPLGDSLLASGPSHCEALRPSASSRISGSDL